MIYTFEIPDRPDGDSVVWLNENLRILAQIEYTGASQALHPYVFIHDESPNDLEFLSDGLKKHKVKNALLAVEVSYDVNQDKPKQPVDMTIIFCSDLTCRHFVKWGKSRVGKAKLPWSKGVRLLVEHLLKCMKKNKQLSDTQKHKISTILSVLEEL